jgi:methionine-rich copper-binding protein CopC
MKSQRSLPMLRRIFFPCSLAALTFSLAAVPAFAHSRPKTMTPAANSIVSAPAEVSVFFTEPLEPKFSSLQLTDEKGTVLSTASSTMEPADHTHLILALPKLAPGVYYVHWISAATDGHRMDGDYAFTVK